MRELPFKELQLLRQDLITQAFDGSYIDNESKNKLNHILLNTPGQTFITIFDFVDFRFKECINLDKYLGYEGGEFNIRALNNDSTQPYQITHPEDMPHTRRYNTIIYELLAKPPEGCSFEVLMDNYELIFRVRHKEGHYLRVRRKCFLMPLNNGRPQSHIDIWEVLSNDYNQHVITRFQLSNKNMNKKISNRFYELNCNHLSFHLTPREREILVLKVEGKFDKEVAAKLGVVCKTVEKRIYDLRKRINRYLAERKINQHVGTTYELIQFALCYGLYPPPKE